MTPGTAAAGTMYELVAAHARTTPKATAIGAPGRPSLSYAGLLEHIDSVGEALHSFGVARNDRVAIVLPNGPEMATSFLAVASFATAAPLNPAYREAEFDFFIEDLKPKVLVVLAGDESAARAVAKRRGVPIVELEPIDVAGWFVLHGAAGTTTPDERAIPSDIALVLHTSGTTSRPKIVPLSHANLCVSACTIRDTLALTPADRVLNVMPLYHIHGIMAATLASIAAGASVVCSPGFDASRFFAWYEEVKPTWYTAVPTIHQAVLAAAREQGALIAKHKLRFMRSSSAAMPPPVMAELERVFGAPLLEAYGMTEASHQMASNPLPPGVRKPGSVGKATGVEIAILDDANTPQPAGVRGEISIRGASVTLGYENNPTANTAAFTNGWFRTGDQGFLDEDGYLTISGRLKEIINKAGEKISPREIDDVLMGHPAVLQVVTFALPHPTLGEDVAAAVVLKSGQAASEAELRQFASAVLADYKVPQRILVVAEVPKGPTGKLKRVGLADHFAAELGAPAYAPAGNEIERVLAAVWAEELKCERVGVTDNYFVLGGDSLQAVMVAAKAKRAGVTFSPNQLFMHPTIAELAKAIAAESGVAPMAASTAVDERLRKATAQVACLDDAAVEDAYGVLAFQHGIVARYEPRLSPTAFVTSWTVDGPLDADVLEQALRNVTARCTALRTGFVKTATVNEPVQYVTRSATPTWERHDLRDTPAAEIDARREAILSAAHAKAFDLTRPPLMRPLLIRLSETRHVLAIVWFHAIVDLWSVSLVERDMLAEYDAIRKGTLLSHPASTPFRDFVSWALAGAAPSDLEEHFLAEFADFPEAEQTAFFRGKTGSFRLPGPTRAVASRPIDEAANLAIASWCRAHAVTPSTLYHGLWGIVQAHHLGVGNVLFGSVVSGRWGDVANIGSIVGPTMGVVPLRLRVTPDTEFVPWLHELQTRLADLQRFSHTRWERIAAVVTPKRRSLLAFCTFVVENLPPELWERPSSDLRFHDFGHRTHMTPPLLLSVFPLPTPHLKATYDTALFAEAEASKLLEGVLKLASALPVLGEKTVGALAAELGARH